MESAILSRNLSYVRGLYARAWTDTFKRRTIDDTGPDGEERPSNDNTSSSGDESSDTDNDNNNENNESGDESSESSSDPFADESAALYVRHQL